MGLSPCFTTTLRAYFPWWTGDVTTDNRSDETSCVPVYWFTFPDSKSPVHWTEARQGAAASNPQAATTWRMFIRGSLRKAQKRARGLEPGDPDHSSVDGRAPAERPGGWSAVP